MRKLASIAFLGPMLLAVVACGGKAPDKVDARDLDPFAPDALCAYHIGDPEAGQAIFNQPVIGGTGGCVTCHSPAAESVLIGPSLKGIAETAEERIPGVIAANYIYLSIIRPDYYVVEGFSADIMPELYAEELSETEVNDLVSYLMTLTEDQ